MGWVDESLQLAKLKLERGAHALGAGDLRDLTNDSQAVLQLPLVIVGHVQDEQVAKIEISPQAFLVTKYPTGSR